MASSNNVTKNYGEISKILYHGTTSIDYKPLISGVDLSKCEQYTDFGKGFYLTSNFNQASRHATKRAKRQSKTHPNSFPLVFVYELSKDCLMESYDGNIFNKMDVRWAEFIYNNRTREIDFLHPFDFVVGPVADGRIFELVKAVDNGLPIEVFLKHINIYKAYDQLSVHNEEIFLYDIIKCTKVVYPYEQEKVYERSRFDINA